MDLKPADMTWSEIRWGTLKSVSTVVICGVVLIAFRRYADPLFQRHETLSGLYPTLMLVIMAVAVRVTSGPFLSRLLGWGKRRDLADSTARR